MFVTKNAPEMMLLHSMLFAHNRQRTACDIETRNIKSYTAVLALVIAACLLSSCASASVQSSATATATTTVTSTITDQLNPDLVAKGTAWLAQNDPSVQHPAWILGGSQITEQYKGITFAVGIIWHEPPGQNDIADVKLLGAQVDSDNRAVFLFGSYSLDSNGRPNHQRPLVIAAIVGGSEDDPSEFRLGAGFVPGIDAWGSWEGPSKCSTLSGAEGAVCKANAYNATQKDPNLPANLQLGNPAALLLGHGLNTFEARTKTGTPPQGVFRSAQELESAPQLSSIDFGTFGFVVQMIS